MTVFLLDMSSHKLQGLQPAIAIGAEINNERRGHVGGFQMGASQYIANGEGPPSPWSLLASGAWVFFAKDRDTIKRAFKRHENCVLAAKSGKFHGLMVGEYRNPGGSNKTWRKIVLGIGGATGLGGAMGRKELVHGVTLDALNDRGYYVVIITNTDFKESNDRSVKRLMPTESLTLKDIVALM